MSNLNGGIAGLLVILSSTVAVAQTAEPGAVYKFLPEQPEAALKWISTYDDTVAAQPNLMLLAGDLHRQRGNFENALSYFDRGAQTFPSDVRFLTELATTKAMIGDLDGAQSNFAEAVALSPRDENARLGLARLLFWNGNAAGAQKEYEALLIDAAERNTVYSDYVRFLIAQQNWTKAKAVMQMAHARGLELQGRAEFDAAIAARRPFKVGATVGTEVGTTTASFRFAADVEVIAEAGYFANAQVSHDGFAAFGQQFAGQLVVPNGWRLDVGAGRRFIRGGGVRVFASGVTNFDSVAIGRVGVEGWTPKFANVTAFGAVQVGTGTQIADASGRIGAALTLPLQLELSETVFAAVDFERASAASMTTLAWRGLDHFQMSLSGIIGSDFDFERAVIDTPRFGAVASAGTTFGSITLDAWLAATTNADFNLDGTRASVVMRVTFAF